MQTVSTPASISSYIQSLNYDARRLLSLPANGSTETLPNPKESAPNGVIICTRKEKSLSGDLEDIAILNPTAGVIFPGALVLANQNLAEGRPDPITLPRNPVTLRVDLPGLGIHGTQVVNSPSNAGVAAALDQVLEYWNAQPAANGYANAAKSNLSITKAHSSEQMALELGFSANWASNQVSTQLRVGNRQESSVYVALYKQVFYTVTMDPPEQPASVFAPDVSISQLQQVINADNPPAYVRSVDYGRMILVRMETSNRETSVNLEGAFSYAMNGGGTLAANVKAEYERVVRNSKFTVVALGGNANVASRIATPEDVNQLRSIIQDGATYSRSNPGTPISYTVAFLKDNRLARMGYTTNYTEMECRQHNNGFVRFRHSGGYVARWFVTWKETDSQGKYTVSKDWKSGSQTSGYTYQLNLPGDAIDINIKAEANTGLAWNPWGQIMDIREPGPTNKGYRVHGTTLNRKWDNNC
ncbi:MAG: thiol-activated cytolysin family protein [Cyanobacteria bacterium Co-bin13]|nr:thiol-activated cytolysin family protein [Cyanobacteria bacterium Co-bin13]